ncbi:MAG: formate/nitrite transporter family protein [Halothece sp. Uz-M2-17]|nr:formate/nitrite transporter family protein [Halothece sp. Uz-M2-17]
MDYTAPREVIAKMAEVGEFKTRLSVKNMLIRGFYSGFLLGIATTLAMTVAVQTGLPIVAALIFPWAFVLIILFGTELVTGNFALMAIAKLSGRTRWGLIVKNWLWVYLGNFLGCLVAGLAISFSLTDAYTIEPNAVAEKIMTIAETRTIGISEMGGSGFLLMIVRGILCNILVCLGVMLGIVSQSVPGKVLTCWLPIMTFVALGLEHIVVNMFFILTGMMLGSPISGTQMVLWNFLPVTIGNLVGGAFFIGFLFYLTYGERVQPKVPSVPAPEAVKK